MKKTSLLIAIAASCLSGLAQTTDSATNPTPAEAAPVLESTNAAPAESPAVVAETTETNAAVVIIEPTVEDTSTTVPVSFGDGSAEVVPLIQIDDAPLPDAIKTLARQAAINFQFDPRVLNPAPDVSGKIPPQPTVSLRWENVTAMEALLALLENYNLQIVKDPKTKIARITAKDAAALPPLITQVYQLDYANPTNLVSILTNTISSRGRVVADLRTSQLVISATEKELDAVEALLKKLDTQTKQVLIEARFLEINKNPRTSKGLDWTDTLAAQRVTFGNTSDHPVTPERAFDQKNNLTGILPSGTLPGSPGVIASTADGFGPVGFLNAQGANVVLSFLNSDADAESIATPRAVTLENVPTELSVVRNIPIFEEEQGVSQGGSQAPATVKPNYLLAGPNGTILNEVGIKLFVTPRIFGNSNVFLDLRPEISDRELKPESTVLSGKVSTSPIFSRRKLQTQAMIPSGYTLVLGGLRQDTKSQSFTKVPILGDLPGIGLLFRKDEKAHDKRDLVIFVTPTIIQNIDFQVAEKSNEFLHREMPKNEDPNWSTWDSGKPADWSKPVDRGVEPRHKSKDATKW